MTYLAGFMRCIDEKYNILDQLYWLSYTCTSYLIAKIRYIIRQLSVSFDIINFHYYNHFSNISKTVLSMRAHTCTI